jgi:simple sugar transport system ATP-binding protein
MAPADELILETRDIIKSFPGVVALDGIDFSMRRGEVHALMGENGAGKTTLIKVLTGVYPPELGEIVFEGRPFRPRSPIEAQHHGISTIYQEVNLIPYLSVGENIFLGRQPRRRFGRIDWAGIRREAQKLLATFDLQVDVDRPLASCSVAIQQMVAIARAVSIQAKLIIMDEPTSSLDEDEVAKLFAIIRQLKARSVSVLFITHFLDQAFEVSDRMTVLRNGRLVGTFETAGLTRLELIGHMLGKGPEAVAALEEEKDSHRGGVGGEPFFRASVARHPDLEQIEVELREGEVLGLAGLLGSGRTETARLLFGVDRPTRALFTIDGSAATLRSPRDAMGHGLGLCPEDRKTDGILPDLSVRENIVLAVQRRLSRLGIVARKKQVAIAERFIKLLGIVAHSLEQPVRTLSGGNQQKVILARWLAMEPRVLILDEPTRGIDVGAKAEVERLVEGLSRDGMAVIFISSEIEEVVRRSHRVAVLSDRRKVAELTGDQIDEHAIMYAIAEAGHHGS